MCVCLMDCKCENERRRTLPPIVFPWQRRQFDAPNRLNYLARTGFANWSLAWRCVPLKHLLNYAAVGFRACVDTRSSPSANTDLSDFGRMIRGSEPACADHHHPHIHAHQITIGASKKKEKRKPSL